MQHWLLTFIAILLEEVMRLLVMFGFAVLVNYTVIYLCTAAWSVYTHTYIGQRFLEISLDMSEQIQTLLDQPVLLSFSFEVAKVTFFVALCVAVVAQFFFIRHLYSRVHVVLKGLLCLAFSAGLAMQYMSDYHLTHLHVATFLFAPSALILLPTCLFSASKLVPDVGQLVLGSWNLLRSVLSR